MMHNVRWYSPAPIWPRRLENGTPDGLRRPELLKFEKDDFMGELQQALAGSPAQFEDRLPEDPEKKGKSDVHDAGGDGPVLSLYHPANERYYLVTASLVCGEHGLPDRAVDTTNDEQVGFVLRRQISEQTENGTEVREYGWFGETHGWHLVEPEDSSLEKKILENDEEVTIEEERLPMFPQNYDTTTPQERMKGQRRLWAGLIPVAKRDTFETASLQPGPGAATKEDPSPDPRRTVFETRIIQAFKNLRDELESATPPEPTNARDRLLFAWLDFWEFLEDYLPTVAEKIEENELAQESDFEARAKEKVSLINALDALNLRPEIGSLGTTASAILQNIAGKSAQIESGNLEDVLPGEEVRNREGDLVTVLNTLLAPIQDDFPQIQREVSAALGSLEQADNVPEHLQPPMADPTTGGRYVVRCVYERPNCPPSQQVLVSTPTRPFRLASFFDAEAPSRDMNITLPGITTEALRGSPQSVTMHFTEELSSQAKKIQKVALDELKAKDDIRKIDLGRVCSLSIPIITICALALLLVMVVVLNIVFWWLPFFKICFPLPSSDG